MTPEPAQDDKPAGRKFDEIASRFGGIVPPAGAPPRPRAPAIPMPPTWPPQNRKDAAPPAPPPIPSDLPPPELPVHEPPAMPPAAPVPTALVVPPPPAKPVVPPAPPRPRPTEIPWPDAFEPRPNYRKPEPRAWSWLLLIPIGAVAAFGFTLIDPRGIRSWLDNNVLHRQPLPVDTSLLPAPFRPGAASAPVLPVTPPPPPSDPRDPHSVPQAQFDPNLPPTPALPLNPQKPADAAQEAPAPTPAPTPQPTAEADAIATPAPEPPPSAPPVVAPQPAEPAPVTIPVKVTVQYRRGQPGAEGEARRIATLLQSEVSTVELHPVAGTVRAPTISYYNPADRDAAGALARTLANEGTGWIVRAGPPRAAGGLDVWLP